MLNNDEESNQTGVEPVAGGLTVKNALVLLCIEIHSRSAFCFLSLFFVAYVYATLLTFNNKYRFMHKTGFFFLFLSLVVLTVIT